MYPAGDNSNQHKYTFVESSDRSPPIAMGSPLAFPTPHLPHGAEPYPTRPPVHGNPSSDSADAVKMEYSAPPRLASKHVPNKDFLKSYIILATLFAFYLVCLGLWLHSHRYPISVAPSNMWKAQSGINVATAVLSAVFLGLIVAFASKAASQRILVQGGTLINVSESLEAWAGPGRAAVALSSAIQQGERRGLLRLFFIALFLGLVTLSTGVITAIFTLGVKNGEAPRNTTIVPFTSYITAPMDITHAPLLDLDELSLEVDGLSSSTFVGQGQFEAGLAGSVVHDMVLESERQPGRAVVQGIHMDVKCGTPETVSNYTFRLIQVDSQHQRVDIAFNISGHHFDDESNLPFKPRPVDQGRSNDPTDVYHATLADTAVWGNGVGYKENKAALVRTPLNLQRSINGTFLSQIGSSITPMTDDRFIYGWNDLSVVFFKINDVEDTAYGSFLDSNGDSAPEYPVDVPPPSDVYDTYIGQNLDGSTPLVGPDTKLNWTINVIGCSLNPKSVQVEVDTLTGLAQPASLPQVDLNRTWSTWLPRLAWRDTSIPAPEQTFNQSFTTLPEKFFSIFDTSLTAFTPAAEAGCAFNSTWFCHPMSLSERYIDQKWRETIGVRALSDPATKSTKGGADVLRGIFDRARIDSLSTFEQTLSNMTARVFYQRAWNSLHTTRLFTIKYESLNTQVHASQEPIQTVVLRINPWAVFVGLASSLGALAMAIILCRPLKSTEPHVYGSSLIQISALLSASDIPAHLLHADSSEIDSLRKLGRFNIALDSDGARLVTNHQV
ncbi:hypothetical protein IE53DRAFT_366295 [Violaceomyces palustris]|uniref:Uncharacterized protein n=1 Tax=Violaceomyces palustris TaxID=1673888 RepID=A0ACD0P614_9BASI|nr:hypothetical protein IE53DRAFT_366295 [Violaceomyces palustris]